MMKRDNKILLMFAVFLLYVVFNVLFVSATIPIPDGCWPLDSDSLFDLSGNDQTGTNSNTVDVAGHIGRARDFESDTDQFIHVDDAVANSPTSGVTMSYWVKLESVGAGNGGGVGKGVGGSSPSFHMMTQTGGVSQPWFIAFDSGSNQVGYPQSSETLATDGTWYHLTFVLDAVADTMKIYVDSVLRASATPTFVGDALFDSVGDLTFGFSGVGSDPYFDGLMDEVKLWKDVLTVDEIIEDYNSGDGVSCSSLFSSGLVINEFNLTDRFRNELGFEISENQSFFLFANVTVDNEVDDGLQCNSTFENIITVFDDFPVNNFTLTNSNSFEFQINEEIDNQVDDIFLMRFCFDNVAKDVEIYINDNVSVYRTINGQIPDCDFGFHEEGNISILAPTTQVNISVRCPSCTGINTMRIISTGEGKLISYFREFNNHTMPLIFNSTTNLYWLDEHLHNHLTHTGLQNITLNCNGTVEVLINNVTSIDPIVNFLNINYDGTIVSFDSNETITESSANTLILADCSNAIPTFFQLNVTYSNGTLIKSVDEEMINLTSDDLNVDDLYNAVFFCRDFGGHESTLVRTFWANDTVNPTINIIKPDGDITVNDTAVIQIQYQDLNLFGVNISVDCDVQGNVFSFFNTSLTGTNFFLDNITDSLTVTQSCTLFTEVCDDHTLIDWSFGSVRTDFLKRNVTIDDHVILSDMSIYDVKSIDFVQKKDRLSFCYEYDTYEDSFKSKVYTYKIPKSSGFVYRGRTLGHYASWDLRKWVDFEPEVGYDITLEGIAEDSKYYYVSVRTDLDRVCYGSVGGLNCRNESLGFDVVVPVVPVEPTVSLASIPINTAIFLGVLAFLYLGLIALGLMSGVLVLASIAFLLIGIIMGIILIPFSATMGIVWILINVLLFIGSVMAD